MGYALVPLVRPEPFKNGRPRRGRRPFGYDQSEHNFVVLDPGDKTQPLSGLALAWFESDITDARVEKVADGKDEPMAALARAKLGARLGRTFRGDPFNAQIVALLKERGLRPRMNGDLTVWLGPGGRGANVFAYERHPATKHSKAWVDTFNRSNGALNGSTLSGGGATWVSATWAISSNTAVLSGVSAEDFGYLDTDADTDDMYGQVEISVNDNGDYAECGISVNLASDQSSGYIAHCNTGGRLLYAISSDTDLGSDAVTTTTGTLKIVRDGSDVEQFVNGVSVLGPTTDVGEASGAGKRRAGFFAFTVLAGASVTLDNFRGGDITPAPDHLLLDDLRVRPWAFSPGFAR